MVPLLEGIGVQLPVAQAGMGGGTAAHELAAAVSEAGGLGTIGIGDPGWLRGEIRTARRLTAKPVAVNLLLPFASRAHWRAAVEADVVVTFWGRPRRRTDRPWLHQCGSLDEAVAARVAGADGVILQGVEAGGHVRGRLPALELLARARAALPDGFPLLLAGGIAEPADVRVALEAGAAAAVAGTRFLLSEESRAHPAYKRRLIAERRTLLTDLFGLGWPAAHRVAPNAATDRWLTAPAESTGSARSLRPAPILARSLNRLSAPLASRLPVGLAARLAASQRPGVPLLGPHSPIVGDPERLIEAAPLYAGETVARIGEIRPAAELVRELVP